MFITSDSLGPETKLQPLVDTNLSVFLLLKAQLSDLVLTVGVKNKARSSLQELNSLAGSRGVPRGVRAVLN